MTVRHKSQRCASSALRSLLLWLLTAFCAQAMAESVRVHYTVQVAADLGVGHGRVCYRHAAPVEFDFAAFLQINIDATSAQPRGGRTDMLQLPDPTECVHYDIRLRRGADSQRKRNDNKNFILLDLDELLPQARTGVALERTVTFILPPDIAVSAPGERLRDFTASYRLLDRPSDWRAAVLIGKSSAFDIVIGSSILRTAIAGRVDAATRDKLRAWLTAGASAIATLYGRFPIDEVQVVVVPSGRSDDPVPWGEVTRGGGDAVHLFVDETKHLSVLNGNWVLVHELSHLLHPYTKSGDSWFAEGVASYYQNVLRARAGLIEARTAWHKLDAGLRRGQRQVERGETLAANTREMMRKRKYMRVYWSGAAIALIADTALRVRAEHPTSLDRVFEAVASCCLPTTRRWSARELMTKMDKLAGSTIFSELHQAYVMGPAFPDITETYRRLGISRPNANLSFSAEAAKRALRSSIMGVD